MRAQDELIAVNGTNVRFVTRKRVAGLIHKHTSAATAATTTTPKGKHGEKAPASLAAVDRTTSTKILRLVLVRGGETEEGGTQTIPAPYTPQSVTTPLQRNTSTLVLYF